jgi:hypothetical protein
VNVESVQRCPATGLDAVILDQISVVVAVKPGKWRIRLSTGYENGVWGITLPGSNMTLARATEVVDRLALEAEVAAGMHEWT